jgi:DNA replication and repair protein RecF
VRRGEARAGSLAVWDERLAAEAAPLIAARAEAVEALAAPFAGHAKALGLERAGLSYRPRAEADAEAIAARLAELRGSAPGRAYLGFGPQLDELVVSASERPLRRFGSQGQQRVALLALLFAERDALLAAGQPPPIMLLDDVMSELDPTHRELLVSRLAAAGQAVVTATEPAQVPAREALRIAVTAGSVRSLAAAA